MVAILEQKHVEGARLFATRHDMLAQMTQSKRGGVIAEIGVAHGDFSEFILDTLAPSKFVAFDTFEMHLHPSHWGIPSEVLFKGMTHEDFYRHRFSAKSTDIVVERGLSHDRLATYAPETFDLIYVDANHTYDDVKQDSLLAANAIKRDGILIFNDYIMHDHLLNEPYGVVQAVNELVVASDWRVIGFALQENMFCDIALAR
ncbi:MAG: class I SAM-dependent methyltransferase [Hyphomicrobiaceae bacterium]